MIIKKSISLLLLVITSHTLYAQTARDGADHSVEVDSQDVEHIRKNQNYVPQPMLSPKETAERDVLQEKQPAKKLTKSVKTLTLSKSLVTLDSATAIEGCSDSVFTSLTGTELLNALRNNGDVCIDTLFNDKPETLVLGAYSDANFATVINEIKAQTLTYNGTDTDDYLSAMFYWLKAYAYYDYRRFVTPASQQSMTDAVNALYANSHFFDKTAANALVVRNATSIIKNAEIGANLVHITKAVLKRFDESYENVDNWGTAVSPLFWQSLNSCASDETCRSQEHTPALITNISQFIYSNIDWLSKPDNDYHLFNLGFQLVGLTKGKNDPHYAAIEAQLILEINKVLNTFGPLETDKARTLYMAVFESIDYNKACEIFDTCDLKEGLIELVLNDRMICPSGTLYIWAQDMTQSQLEWTCNSLGAHETYFHETLKTNEIPVTPDDNDKLHMIIFNDKTEWVTYGGALFGVSTSNGGTYREGDPSKNGAEATFYAYEDVPERPIFDVWNLRHEYIHYLEGRFISKGDFRESDDAGRTTWFGEGIAEYISLRDCNAGAIAEAQTGDYALSAIFNNEYGVGQTRIYDWGYLANRYMYERENTQFFAMLEVLKEGDFEAYRTDMVDPWIDNKSFDADFATWLTTLESTGCTVDTTRPESPIEPVNVDDIQGSDVPVIDACALGRTPTSTNPKAGHAMCLVDKADGGLVQLGLRVPNGLVNVSLEITLRHGSGNADLLHRWDARPSSTISDHSSTGVSNDETILVSPVAAGWNYIHVPAANEFSNVTLLARYIQNDVTVADNELENGIAKIVSGERSEQVNFIMEVPESATALTFDISGGTGDADLYVKFGSAPTTNDYDCRPYKEGNTEHCDMENIQAGIYHVMLRGYNSFTDVNLVGNYRTQIANSSPIAILDGPYTANTNEIIVMDSSTSSDSDGSIVSQIWDFGDGTSSTLVTPRHVYASANIYTITLTVTDNEGTSSTSSTTATIEPSTTPTTPGLQNGVIDLVSGITGGETFYTMTIPAGASNLSFSTSGGTGDVDMHVKFGSEATKTDYDCRPWKVGSKETCNINNDQAGTYYIMLLGYNDFTNVNLVGSYSITP
jgi:microbial collagenase